MHPHWHWFSCVYTCTSAFLQFTLWIKSAIVSGPRSCSSEPFPLVVRGCSQPFSLVPQSWAYIHCRSLVVSLIFKCVLICFRWTPLTMVAVTMTTKPWTTMKASKETGGTKARKWTMYDCSSESDYWKTDCTFSKKWLGDWMNATDDSFAFLA